MNVFQFDRYLECKTNKASSSWSGSSACVSLSGFNGSFVVSGHFDGALLTTGSRLIARHPVSPNALCVLENAVSIHTCHYFQNFIEYVARAYTLYLRYLLLVAINELSFMIILED